MLYMNDYDLACAKSRYDGGDTPNRYALVVVVSRLREWANNNSDGWAYWPKPVRAAKRAIELINGNESADITVADMNAALRPIKAFMTRQNVCVCEREYILPEYLVGS